MPMANGAQDWPMAETWASGAGTLKHYTGGVEMPAENAGTLGTINFLSVELQRRP